MLILIRKRHIVFGGLLCCFFAVLGMVFLSWQEGEALPTLAVGSSASELILVIDPGHGGEDSGAVSTNGSVMESHLNLEIAQRVEDLMNFLGQRTVMTRREDVSIHSESAKNTRERKVSDLHNRVALVNGLENAVLLSIHQNSLPSSTVTHGAQVFWNSREGAESWAQSVQDALNQTINVGNEKHTKQIPSTIYLMKNITTPGILVECGFLSNSGETAMLQQPAHQLKLAAAITAGCRSVEEGQL